MRQKLAVGISAVLIAVVNTGLIARHASSATPLAQSSNQTQLTITGCLQRGDQSAAGASGAASAAGRVAADTSTKFMLIDVKPSGALETAGTSGAKSGAIASSYRLDADESKLTSHVGHKVEITGTVATGTVANPGATESAEPGATASAAPRLKVDSVRMLASTCSE